jgi:septal ring factor EnvC (AmiA/AmiB activator)
MRYLGMCIITSVSLLLFASCGNLSTEVENRLDELKKKTESLDSLVNTEVDKVSQLDSLILNESEKVKQLDTLINKSSSKLDSIVQKGNNILEKINN